MSKLKAVESAAKSLSTEVPELERLKWRLRLERQARIGAQLQALETGHAALKAEQQSVAKEHEDAMAALRKTHGLTDADSVDLATGAITRAPSPSSAPGT